VQEQDWRAIATDKNIDCRAAGLDLLAPKSWKEVHRACGCGLSECRRALHGHSRSNYA
jgi:hypothetical protein